MRTCCFLFFIFVLLLSDLSLYARINETVTQCNERYGTPKKENTNGAYLQKYYFKNDMNILIVFFNNRAVLISYARPNLKDTFYLNNDDYKKTGWVDTITNQNSLINMNLPMTEKEIDYLKNSNSQNEKWTKTGKTSWLREKRNVKATYFPNRCIFSIEMLKYDIEEQDNPNLKLNGL